MVLAKYSPFDQDVFCHGSKIQYQILRWRVLLRGFRLLWARIWTPKISLMTDWRSAGRFSQTTMLNFWGKTTCRLSIVHWRDFSCPDPCSLRSRTPNEPLKPNIWDYGFSDFSRKHPVCSSVLYQIMKKYMSTYFNPQIWRTNFFNKLNFGVTSLQDCRGQVDWGYS